MSLQIFFEYDEPPTDESAPRSSEIWGIFFEVYPEDYDDETRRQVENSPLYVEFVREFPKNRDVELTEWPDLEIIEAMERDDWPPPYVGSSFPASQLVAWAQAWLETVPELDEREKQGMGFLTEHGFDWTPSVIEDLQAALEQGRYAEAHGISLHLEMY